MRMGVIGVAGLVALSALGGCSGSTPQDFSVTGVLATPAASQFGNTDPAVDAVLAKQICADGYEKLGEQSIPADKGSFSKWQLRCTQYHVSLF